MRYRTSTEHDSVLSSKFTRTLLYTASAMTLAVSATSVAAQTAETATDEQPATAETPAVDDDVIVVSGFRKSLSDALASKRNSGNVTDAISAEDIGKSTDKNIAEALQRVTGVSISREDGEGTSVVVRGASADLNSITLNGVPLTSGGANQSVDLSNFSSDVISSIEVVKTPSADHDEGSLGASVRLNTFKPLDSRKNRRVFELQTSYNSFEDEDFIIGDDFFGGDYRANIALSQKLLDNRLGISVVATKERRTTRKDSIFTTGYPTFAPRAGATNADTGVVDTQFDYGNGLEDLRLVGIENQSYNFERIQRDRMTIAGTVQYQPTDSTDILINATYTSQDIDRNASRYQVNTDLANRQPGVAGLEGNIVYDPSTLTIIRNVATAVTNGPNNINREPAVLLGETINRTEEETFVLSGEIEQRLGDFTLSLSGGHSETTANNPYNFFVRFNNNRPRRTGRTIGYDCGATPDLCQLVVPSEYVTDPSLMVFQTSSINEVLTKDVSDSVYFDVDWDKTFGPISSFEAGFKWSSRRKESQANSTRFNNAETGGVLTAAGLTLADFVRNGRTPGDFGQALGLTDPTFANGWFQVDGDLVFQRLSELLPDGPPESRINLRNTRDIKNEVFGGYVKANLDMFEGRVLGDIGLRGVKTNVTSNGFSGYDFEPIPYTSTGTNIAFFGSEAAAIAALGRNTIGEAPPTPTVGTHSYTNFLPSLNLNWIATDDIILRFAASQTIARPRIDDTQPGFTITERAFDVSSNARLGAPQLNPFKSTNIDLSAEWYFAKDSLFSVAIFNKNLSDFAETNSFQAYYVDNRAELFAADGSVLPADQIDFVADISQVLLPFSGGPNQAGCMPNREQDLGNPEGEPGCDLLIVTQPRNGTGGYVRGAEVSFQHNFTYLPGIFSGLGIVANYTYSDSQADAEFDENGVQTFAEAPLLGTSEHTFNITGFYERNGVLLRLAYNKRSDFLLSRSTSDGNSEWREGGESLDLSAGWDINHYMSINFQAVNLLDSVQRDYVKIGPDPTGIVPTEDFAFGGITSRTSDISNTGRLFRFGVRFQF